MSFRLLRSPEQEARQREADVENNRMWLWERLITGRSRRETRVKRYGAILAAVLVCLLTVMLLGTALVQNLVLQQRQTRAEQDHLQAFWLAESALNRAAAELRSDPQYTGTDWQIEIVGPHGPQTGVAEIRVASDEGSPRQRRIQIVARWPNDPPHRYVHHQELVINLADSGDSQ